MTITNRKTWLFWWILANIIGSIIGCFFGSYLATLLRFLELDWWIFMLGISISIGLAQSLIIRKIVNPYLWAILTSVGLYLGLTSSFLILPRLTMFNTLTSSPTLTVLLAGSAIGTITGLFQWFLLRTKYSNANLWILANTIAYATSFVIFFGLGVRFFLDSPPFTIVFCILSFLVNGWITGKAMQEISLQSRIAKRNEKSID